MSPELEVLILRLLAIAPVERFKGRARQAAEALEYAAQGEGTQGDEPLFCWGEERGLRLRSAEEARLAAERDAAAREHPTAREARARSRPKPGASRTRRWSFTLGAGAAVAVCLLAAGLLVAVQLRGRREAAVDTNARGSHVEVGDGAGTPPAGTATGSHGDNTQGIAAPMPEQPLPDQSKPPCKGFGEVEIRGGCWHELARAKPPCKAPGKEDAFEWKGACYWPSFPRGRQPTSGPP